MFSLERYVILTVIDQCVGVQGQTAGCGHSFNHSFFICIRAHRKNKKCKRTEGQTEEDASAYNNTKQNITK